MVFLLVALTGCGGKQTNAVPQSMSLSPSANVHLRNSFDTDPSAYLGRFVPDTASGAYDESSSMSLSCSQYVTYRRVDGGGVRYNELLEVSSAASARLGVPLIADASGSGSTNRIIRVSYELTGKMIGEITDPAGFEACCKASPDQCTRRYIGEFIEGRGAIYHEVSNSVQAEASGTDPSSGVNGNIEFSHGTAWARGVEFPNPVFFAFKISETPYNQQSTSSCADFMTTLPPGDEDGVYLLGSHTNAARDEATARRRALRNATISAYSAFGITPDLQSSVSVEVQEREWCVENQGDQFSAKVLAYAKRPPEQPTPPPPTSPSVPETTGGADRQISAAPVTAAPPATGGSGGALTPMQANALAQLQAGIAAASFSDDKLALVRTAAVGNAFTVAQVVTLLNGFSFDSDKVEAVTILRSSVVDPQNAALLMGSFTFSSDQQTVMSLFQ